MGPSIHHRHPGAHAIRQNNQFEYEGLAGTLLDLWVEELTAPSMSSECGRPISSLGAAK